MAQLVIRIEDVTLDDGSDSLKITVSRLREPRDRQHQELGPLPSTKLAAMILGRLVDLDVLDEAEVREKIGLCHGQS